MEMTRTSDRSLEANGTIIITFNKMREGITVVVHYSINELREGFTVVVYYIHLIND